MPRKLVAKIILYAGIIFWGASGAHAGQLENVLIISIDALHPAAINDKTTPAIYRVMRKGAFTLNGKSTEPPKTLISHAAMFTGLSPKDNGKQDNQWRFGETGVEKETIFNDAKRSGYSTAYFFSKEKLGYLVNSAVDLHQWSQENAIDLAGAFIAEPGRHFVFLHVGGLDYVGSQYGWLSAEYMEALFYIDDYLSTLLSVLKNKKSYLLIITGDHAGHDKIHGSRHPEDYRLPFIISSDIMNVKEFQNKTYSVIDLKGILDRIINRSFP